jgi:hypothetical protein
MFSLPWKYAVTAAKSWGRAISGPVLGVVGIGLLGLQQAMKDAPTAALWLNRGGWITLATAGVMILVAQYEVWKEEYEAKLKAQTELNSEANIQGTVDVFPIDNPYGLGFQCNCANHGRKPCQISRIVFRARLNDGQEIHRNIRLWDPAVKTVAYGERFGESGSIRISEEEATRVALRRAEITVYLVDSLGIEYHNIRTEPQFPDSGKAIQESSDLRLTLLSVIIGGDAVELPDRADLRGHYTVHPIIRNDSNKPVSVRAVQWKSHERTKSEKLIANGLKNGLQVKLGSEPWKRGGTETAIVNPGEVFRASIEAIGLPLVRLEMIRADRQFGQLTLSVDNEDMTFTV